jgi:hypothetical protein
LQYDDYGAAAKVKHMEMHFNVLNLARPLTGMVIASGGGTSFHLQPKVAATDGHRSLNFSGTRTEFGHAGESGGHSRTMTSILSSASGKVSLVSGISGYISEELSVAKSDCKSEELSKANASSGASSLSVAKSDCKSEELSKANASSGVSTPSPTQGFSL